MGVTRVLTCWDVMFWPFVNLGIFNKNTLIFDHKILVLNPEILTLPLFVRNTLIQNALGAPNIFGLSRGAPQA